MRRSRIALLAALACCAAGPEARASGFYNMPTSLPQCLGFGCGPGYHAPMLLGPMLRGSVAAQPLRRLPAPLPPPPTHTMFEGPSRLSHDTGAYSADFGSAAYSPTSHFAPVTYDYQAGPALSAPSADPHAGYEVVPAPKPAR